MKCKKILAMLLAAAMSVGCLAACGQQAGTNKESQNATGSKVEESQAETSSVVEEEPSLFNAPGTLPIVNEPITLKILTQDTAANKLIDGKTANSKLWKWLEEQTGIQIEVESYPVEELKTKLPLIMSTPDDMPDMFWRCNMSAADIMNYGQNGQILALDELIAEYAPTIQEILTTKEGAYGAAASADGKIYSLPAFNGSVASVNGGAINQQFLDNIGMDAPATWAELYEVFKAIKAHGDANGDGIQNNEICWSTNAAFFRRNAFVNAGLEVYWPYTGVMFDQEDDEVFFVPTSGRYKEMLTWLNKFYEEGMLDPEMFTQSGAEVQAKYDENRVFLKSAAADPENANFVGPEGDRYIVPLTLHEGETPIVITGADYQTDIGVISAYTEYPEICMMLMDFMYTEEASMVASVGMEDVDFTVTSEEPFIINYFEGHAMSENASEYVCLVPRWRRSEWIQPAATQMNQGLADLTSEYGVMGFQNYLKFTTEESDTIAITSTDLGLFCDDYFIGFIDGTYDIVADWDAYVAECNKMKVAEITKIYQAAYNRYYGLD